MTGVGALLYDNGVKDGEKNGEKNGRIKSLYYDMELTFDEISEKTGVSVEEIQDILSETSEAWM